MSATKSLKSFLNLLFALVFQLGSVCGHLRFLCPPPRSCFYGISPSNSNPDGIWRESPCGHSPASPSTTVTSGTSMCLRVYEFVPHEGYFTISISPEALGPGDDDTSFITLDTTDDITDDTTDTGVQAFMVTIPDDLTCDHCTIQVAQYSEDLDWYYYTCTDIKVVANGTQTGGSDGGLVAGDLCYDEGSEWSAECEWKEADGLIRIMILQDIILGSVGLFNALLVIGLIFYASKCCKKFACCDSVCKKCENTSDDVQEVNEKIHSAGECFQIVVKNYLKLWIGVSVFVVLNFVVTAFIIVLLKECEIADDYADITV